MIGYGGCCVDRMLLLVCVVLDPSFVSHTYLHYIRCSSAHTTCYMHIHTYMYIHVIQYIHVKVVVFRSDPDMT